VLAPADDVIEHLGQMTPSDTRALRQHRFVHPCIGFLIKPAAQKPVKIVVFHTCSN
jgi:hypothetical protein